MRKLIVLAAVFAVALPALAGNEADTRTPSGWFDMANCAFCESLLEDPGLMAHTTWEGHPIADGMMYIMTVEPEYAESMAKAGAAMAQVGTEIQSGKRNPMTTPMCGHCKEFGMIMMSGVNMETVQGDAADVTIYTSDDEATVKRMHALVKRDHEEMALMASAEGDHGDHKGHGHN
ncbi:MAG: hypothetical protein GY838_01095 [bacterium]|nr:hypothetical protein [bacterium]